MNLRPNRFRNNWTMASMAFLAAGGTLNMVLRHYALSAGWIDGVMGLCLGAGIGASIVGMRRASREAAEESCR